MYLCSCNHMEKSLSVFLKQLTLVPHLRWNWRCEDSSMSCLRRSSFIFSGIYFTDFSNFSFQTDKGLIGNELVHSKLLFFIWIIISIMLFFIYIFLQKPNSWNYVGYRIYFLHKYKFVFIGILLFSVFANSQQRHNFCWINYICIFH